MKYKIEDKSGEEWYQEKYIITKGVDVICVCSNKEYAEKITQALEYFETSPFNNMPENWRLSPVTQTAPIRGHEVVNPAFGGFIATC